jgi:hypothetical protein
MACTGVEFVDTNGETIAYGRICTVLQILTSPISRMQIIQIILARSSEHAVSTHIPSYLPFGCRAWRISHCYIDEECQILRGRGGAHGRRGISDVDW